MTYHMTILSCPQVVQEYLQLYKIPARANVNNETMMNLFKNVVER